MFSKALLESFKDTIDEATNIAIFGHESVDGDAVGSMLAVGNMVEKLGKHVGYFTTLAPGRGFDFLEEAAHIRTDFDYGTTTKWDLIIFVDFTGYKRIAKLTEGHEEYFDSIDKIVVDHHLGNETPNNTLLLKDPDASSNCELLYEIFSDIDAFAPLMDEQIATYLYMGLTTDTGNFQYEKDSVRTMENALGLIRLGAKKAWLLQKLFNNADPASLDLLKILIPRIVRKDQIMYVRYILEEVEKFGFDKDEADLLLLRNMTNQKDTGVFAIIRKSADKVGISLRSGYLAGDKRINVQLIAGALGGGGHMYAAGGRVAIEGEFSTQVDKIVKTIETEMNKQL